MKNQRVIGSGRPRKCHWCFGVAATTLESGFSCASEGEAASAIPVATPAAAPSRRTSSKRIIRPPGQGIAETTGTPALPEPSGRLRGQPALAPELLRRVGVDQRGHDLVEVA